MKTTDFDKFSVPVDTLARIVTSPKKPEYEYETANADHWKAPPPTQPFPDDLRLRTAMLRVGDTFGRFTVVGYLGRATVKSYNGARALYLVRCTCGDYESRSAHELRSGKPRLRHMRACFNCLRWDNTKSHYDLPL